jgi:hypothetical protein
MAVDPLDQVLKLVAEGRLTADEAAPILAALDDTRGESGAPVGDPAPGPASATPDPRGTPSGGTTTRGGGATSLRLEIRDQGRQVVNLRLPLAVGKLALDRIPGLSGDQVERVRAALATGARGPILEVDDEGDSVRIVVE